MKWKNFVYNSISMSLPKNIVQFLVGVILFTMIFGYLNIGLTLLGLVGFVLSYSSIYLLNDIKDAEEDRKDEMKLKWKMIANGTLSIKKAIVLYFVLIISGLSISFLVNSWFALMMITLIAVNIFYSVLKVKRCMPIASVFLLVMQFLKFSTGWFVLTTSLTLFPFWLVMTLALAYTAIFVGYKLKFKKELMKKQKWLFVVLGIVLLTSFGFSIVLHDFPLIVLLLFALSISWIVISKRSGLKHYTHKTMLLFYVSILPMIVISFLILTIPVAAEINSDLNATFHEYKIGIEDNLPSQIIDPIKEIEKTFTQYSDLNEIIELDFFET
ncbi:MAG: UbiA family prenyltransferase [Nanoarchaeota archaeon]|nr:UbiA family prenyltransferase [Nanoarchaeota archaeon]MBU1135305.1 UbiA family prenyltransferase [Nanoarchaeota archaeon]MBU2519767.1 UbiA family prenyltransferase [Nanoarchaeota archaeon]